MSNISDYRVIKSDGFRNLNRLQNSQSFKGFMNLSLISNASNAASSTINTNHSTRRQTFTTGSNSGIIRYHEQINQNSKIRDPIRRPNLNEQTQYSNNHRFCTKRHSTTFYTSSESTSIKRSCLPPVSYPTLTKLIDKSSDDILAEMLHPNFQLNKFLNDKRMRERYDWIYSMTKLLEKTTQCIGSRERILIVFKQLPDTRYLEGVYDEIKKFDPNTNELRFKFIELFLKISNIFIDMIPHSVNGLSKIFERIELLFIKNKFDSHEFEDAKQILDEVLQRIKQIEQREQKRQELLNLTNCKTIIKYDINQPPENYRHLSIVPTVKEILSEQQTYLRKNIVDGVYENAEQYLDIHFRLLREDFVGPLRDGIQQYLSKIKGKNYNIRIYENVHLYGSRLTPQNGIVYDLLLDSKIASRIYWSNSRRLIYGNLLLITFNNFQSYVFVTVEDRSQIEKNFIVSVKTLEKFNQYERTQIHLDKIDFSCSLTVIETMTYFQAYDPVLNALKQIPSDYRFPLASFILKLTKEMVPPDYIKPTTTYDFTPLLVHPDSNIKTNHSLHKALPHVPLMNSIITKEFQINYEQSNQIENKYKKISVLNKDEWPTNEQLHLNLKQYEALILALTNKVALIQGPPGTGKTFLGVRITEMLLYNRSVWCPSDEQSTPILIICHTNHALDQFLELIVKRLNIQEGFNNNFIKLNLLFRLFILGIIRVGNRCQNSRIQHFSLSNARQVARENRSIPKDVYHEKRELLDEKIETDCFLKLQQYKMDMSKINIIPLLSLTECSIINHKHYISLLKPYYGCMTETALLEWLGLGNQCEQIQNHFIYNENLKRNISQMEINDYIEEKQTTDQDEEDEEEERRRDEFDTEEYQYFPLSTVLKPETIIGNPIDIEILSKDKYNNERKWITPSNNSNDIHRLIQHIIQDPTTLHDETVRQINDDIWQLTMDQRYDLYRYWLFKYRQYLRCCIHDGNKKYNKTASALIKHRQEEDYHILKDSIIVAMTTTCAAKYHTVLEKLQSKIVIVEEAAAIFESHIITALNTNCQHLILIGDHIQLRPNPSVYRLAVKYNIDISLFERFIKNNFPNVRLNIQHRMRPEIARLMKHFYDDLEDHITVKTDRPPIRGVDNNLFFINHDHTETTLNDGSSKQNEFEGEYVIKLAEYFIKQDYKPSQITILVMYLGQKQFIVKQVKQKGILHGVRIMVTDNYQGEENDIIILSLVRSNLEKKIGFLKTHNRICVALSRARCGLFVIGNINLFAEVDEKWKEILRTLSETNHIGNGLSLCCRQHSNYKFLADKVESFAQRPQGGCKRTCDARLKCGHTCQLRCHNYDLEHNDIICNKKCNERLLCGHSCAKQCHVETPDQHGSCRIPIEKTISECGHQIFIECCKTPTIKDCKKSSLKKLTCGHIVDVPCRIIPSSYEFKRFPCPRPCDTILACQHKCIGNCRDCHTGRLHVPCGEKCERQLICSHVCKVSCATNCPPCSRQCEIRCVHSRCTRKCGDICTPCKEQCAYKCRHLNCTRLCSEPCSRGPCNKPCNKKLKCGHYCIGICGEPCPRECRICDKHIVEEIFFGSEDEPDARFVLLPDCRHIFEVTALDKYIENFINDSDNKIAIRFPECPRCRQMIHRCTRYTSIINQVYNSISQVKKKILGNNSKQEKNNRREQLIKDYKKMKNNLKEIPLDKSMIDYFGKLYDKNNLFSDMLNLMENIIGFINEIDQLLVDGCEKLQKTILEDFVLFPLRHIVKYLFTQQQHYRNFAEQQLNDIQSELKRIRRVIYIETLVFSLKQTLKENEKECIDSMLYLTKKSGPFTDQDRQKFDDLVKKFESLNNLPGLGINERERIAIVSAFNLSKGRWFLCPKGHPYIITECGGANQESQCPDCGEQIGGKNHQVLATNRHFGVMDNSEHAVWSNEANLNLRHALF
ncbi:unnamed protein product [Rotaria sordida]|uniref:RZ-type domain-containing protein n=1 Tax=Rotaria sordida TaxID=392033 RepID=A0A814EQC6_9BILA|nr:unnamed protein product [Rotaria sordida]